MFDWFFFTGDFAVTPVNVPALMLGLMLSFLLGHLLAWVYTLTHGGLSYSRSFVNSLVVTPVLVALVMSVLANNIVTAFGLMAVFAIVRFRNILRDTLDTSYVLAGIVMGMGCGTQKFSTALIGGMIIVGILVYLWFVGFGSRHRYDLIVNLLWTRPMDEILELQSLLERHSLRTQLASQRGRDANSGVDVSYRLLMRDPSRLPDLFNEVQGLEGVAQLSTMRAEEESEL